VYRDGGIRGNEMDSVQVVEEGVVGRKDSYEKIGKRQGKKTPRSNFILFYFILFLFIVI